MNVLLLLLLFVNIINCLKVNLQQNNKLSYILKHNQIIYKKLLSDDKLPIIICTGSAGTGKTMIACHDAIENLNKNKIDKIIITRPTVTAHEELGFLPGTIQDKLHPFMIPIYDYFTDGFSKETVKKMISTGIIEIAPLAYMRGRTFTNSYIIADEMQNSTPNQFKMLLTRIGLNSKIVVTGDLEQNDLNIPNGLEHFISLLNDKYGYDDTITNTNNGIGLINLKNNCIQRHRVINEILSIYEI